MLTPEVLDRLEELQQKYDHDPTLMTPQQHAEYEQLLKEVAPFAIQAIRAQWDYEQRMREMIGHEHP